MAENAEDRGINPSFKDFSDYWMKHLRYHWYAEYSFCLYNLKRGLKPPISGAFQNHFLMRWILQLEVKYGHV